MRDVYLRINYGSVERFRMVSRTIRVSAPYFKEIRVFNFGTDENAEKFKDLLQEFPNLKISNYGKHHHSTLTEDLIRCFFIDVPDGAWISWLDSDWRFPQYFLDHMQEEIGICEAGGFNHLFSYEWGHNLDPNADHNYTQSSIDAFIKEQELHPDNYGWPILQKVDKKNLWCDGFMGNHSYFIHIPYNKRCVPRMYHLHNRDYSDHAYCSSIIYQSWWYIGHNVFEIKEQNDVYNSWEYDMLENFKLRHNCLTPNKFHEMKKDPSFVTILRNLFIKFKDSKIAQCQQMYRMANKYDMVFLGTDPIDYPCDGPCCKYHCGKIGDLPI